MAALVYFALAALCLAVAIAFARNVGAVAELPIHRHLEWRKRAGRFVYWLSPRPVAERQMRQVVWMARATFSIIFLIFASVLFLAGIVAAS